MRKTVVALGSALTLCAPNFGYAGEFGGIGISLGGQVALPIRDQVDPPQGYGCISGIAHFGRKIWRAGGEIGACGNPLEGNVVMAGLNHGFTKLFGPMYLTGYNTLGLSYWRADIDLNSPPSWRSDSPARFRAVTAYLKPQLGVGIPLPAGAIEVSAYVSLHAPIEQ